MQRTLILLTAFSLAAARENEKKEIKYNECYIEFGLKSLNYRNDFWGIDYQPLEQVDHNPTYKSSFSIISHVYLCDNTIAPERRTQFDQITLDCNPAEFVTSSPHVDQNYSNESFKAYAVKKRTGFFNELRLSGEDCKNPYKYYFWPTHNKFLNSEEEKFKSNAIFLFKENDAKVKFLSSGYLQPYLLPKPAQEEGESRYANDNSLLSELSDDSPLEKPNNMSKLPKNESADQMNSLFNTSDKLSLTSSQGHEQNKSQEKNSFQISERLII